MNRRLALLVLLLATPALHAAGPTHTVTLLHFSDYHSHALPFDSEARAAQGGLARAIGYLGRQKAAGALVFSGGDMINKGSPAWSDKYQCAEWPWLDGIVDAMAFGNHDPDYSREQFDRCRAAVRYPILSANTTLDGATQQPAPYQVFTVHGLRIGVLAVAGTDFPSLVKAQGIHFSDPIAAARKAVDALRKVEHVDAVVSIGHESIEDDFALARAVPGIDLIFGSHSHLKRDLQRIDGTKTWFISPFQYLTYISRVELTFRGHELVAVHGRLVRVDDSIRADPKVARRIAEMERDLEHDPQYAPLFTQIGTAAVRLDVDGQMERDAAFPDLALDVMRSAAHADLAISTASSFRQSIAAGRVTMEALRNAMPYDNEIVVYTLTGAQVQALLAYSATRIHTDFFGQISGVRMTIERDGVRVEGLDPRKTYRVATTEYLASVAPGYSPLFAGLTPERTGVRVRDEVRKYFAAHSPVKASADGRIRATASR